MLRYEPEVALSVRKACEACTRCGHNHTVSLDPRSRALSPCSRLQLARHFQRTCHLCTNIMHPGGGCFCSTTRTFVALCCLPLASFVVYCGYILLRRLPGDTTTNDNLQEGHRDPPEPATTKDDVPPFPWEGVDNSTAAAEKQSGWTADAVDVDDFLNSMTFSQPTLRSPSCPCCQ